MLSVALEFLPQNRRYLLSLLSIWQPIGVVVASAITFGTVPKYRYVRGYARRVCGGTNR